MNNQANNEIFQKTAHLFRAYSGKMVAILTRYYGIGQLENIMDAVQESFEAALKHWRYKGLPDAPEAWLLKTTKNKLINLIKRENIANNLNIPIPESYDFSPDEKQIADSQLQLLLRICELKLPLKSQIIFTLYTLSGFGVPEIGNALLMTNEAAKKHIFRTKQLLQNTRFNFDELPEKYLNTNLNQLHLVLYLMFNEGYKTTRAKEGLNIDLCYEAMRLAKLLLQLRPNDTATNALLALMFFNAARFSARISSENFWISLEQQDRSLWDPALIREGMYYLHLSKNSQQLGKYHLEAIIASIHCCATNFKATDWQKIIYLYEQIEILEGPSTTLSLNKIIAWSYLSPSEDLLEQLHALGKTLNPEHQLFFHLAKAHLNSLLHRYSAAENCYREALDCAQSPIDKQFILNKITNISVSSKTTRS